MSEGQNLSVLIKLSPFISPGHSFHCLPITGDSTPLETSRQPFPVTTPTHPPTSADTGMMHVWEYEYMYIRASISFVQRYAVPRWKLSIVLQVLAVRCTLSRPHSI